MTNGKELGSRMKPFENGNGNGELKRDSQRMEILKECIWHMEWSTGKLTALRGNYIEKGCHLCSGYDNKKGCYTGG